MKYIILIFSFCLVVNLGFGQGMIADIMNVESVSIDLSQENEKLIAQYEETLTKESADLDNALAKIDEAYQSNVTKLINDFSKVLNNGKREIISKSKTSIVTKIKSLTMTHRTSKKNRVKEFLNNMQGANHKLPQFMRKESALEVKDKGSNYFATFETDYETNMNSIKAFQQQEHIIITGDKPTATADKS